MRIWDRNATSTGVSLGGVGAGVSGSWCASVRSRVSVWTGLSVAWVPGRDRNSSQGAPSPRMPSSTPAPRPDPCGGWELQRVALRWWWYQTSALQQYSVRQPVVVHSVIALASRSASICPYAPIQLCHSSHALGRDRHGGGQRWQQGLPLCLVCLVRCETLAVLT